MANIMSMADIKNRPSRNGFDLSFKKNFSAKAGELLPVMCKVVVPGDSININLKSFTRTQPLNTSAFARMREYFDFYFVPFDQLWNKFGTVITQMNQNVQHASGPNYEDNLELSGLMPYLSCQQIADYVNQISNNGNYKNNAFGFNRGFLTVKLLQYLGYGDFSAYVKKENTWSSKSMLQNLNMSVFPLMAYQKIYADFYRYSQWETTNPSTFNCDYVKGTADLNLDISSYPYSADINYFDVRYCNYMKDLFHGVLPQAQFGSEAVVPITGGVGNNIPVSPINSQSIPTFSNDESAGSFEVKFDAAAGAFQTPSSDDTFTLGWKDPQLQVEVSNLTLSILALRQAEFLQKWKEVAAAGEQDYKSQIQKHWGISVSDYLSHQARYLGGCATSLDINPVVNNNITGGNAADIAGLGTFSGNGSIHFDSKAEYGIIMCIYHVLPIVDYIGSGVEHHCTLTDATSFPIPEMDKVGMELVPMARMMNPNTTVPGVNDTTFLGYAPRYIDWKTSVDRSVGAFSSTLKTWCLPADDNFLRAAVSTGFSETSDVKSESVGAGFFKVNPSVVDPLFAVFADSSVATDEFLVSSYFDIKAVRNLDVNGLPY
nr:MAG: major capsid protein [Microvirus sp.]